MNYNNKSILITGGAGFIGSNLAFFFQDNFPNTEIVIFDCFRNNERFENGNLKSFGHYSNLIHFKGDVICGDLNNKEDLLKLSEYKFDFIFHHAAISDTRIYNQELIMRTNVNSFYDILELAKNNDAVLIYASSAATYGNAQSPQRIGKENPQNPYGYSKFVMDQIATRFCKRNKEMVVIGLRFFNVYGPNEFFKEKTASMILQLGHQIIRNTEPRLFNNSEKIYRDFIYIDDVIKANVIASQAEKSGIYNVGTGTPRSFKEIVDILQKELKKNLNIEYFANPYSDYQNHTQADISSLKEDLNFEPSISLEDGIKLYSKEIIKTSNMEFYV
jgi:ADP-L-glycero-D-manno-heptose 6-epimerase